MATRKISNTKCAVNGCKTTTFNKSVAVKFHPFPKIKENSNKWFGILKNHCFELNQIESLICSKHFENKYFDPQRKLKDNAIPTLFPQNSIINKKMQLESQPPRNKIDILLNKLNQSELTNDINSTMKLIQVPEDYCDCVNEELQCLPDTPVEAQLWLLIKKQDHLITRLTQQVSHNKKHVEVLQKNMEESRSAKRELEQKVETQKYIVKSLQEKQTTLEEQIEILTAVESR